MLFPELTERVRRLFRMKNLDEPVHSIPQDRPLTFEEHALTEWLLLHGEPQARDFLPQLENMHVHAKCSCGCPTIDLRVSEVIPCANPQTRVLADFVGVVDGNFVGVLLHQRGGRVCELEVYSMSGTDGARLAGYIDSAPVLRLRGGGLPQEADRRELSRCPGRRAGGNSDMPGWAAR